MRIFWEVFLYFFLIIYNLTLDTQVINIYDTQVTCIQDAQNRYRIVLIKRLVFFCQYFYIIKNWISLFKGIHYGNLRNICNNLLFLPLISLNQIALFSLYGKINNKNPKDILLGILNWWSLEIGYIRFFIAASICSFSKLPK